MENRLDDAVRDGRARGAILELVRRRHRAQNSRFDHVELWHMLRGIGIDVGENDVITYLQDLEVLELIEFATDKDRRTNRTSITHIQLCARGLRLLDGKITEDTVLL
ncbi:hypothetical protein FTO74_14355 [Granulicella sp. WH15]|uniref:hypothetical protein n=1 Tax=Granulicella sp. WH15 TaxID=2602070 RepID=UPI0013677119|nr:hypothetical protein [Granulicella sp. WH15]QHN04414.1 hypothetical protein FTO74_14355 [Granulicella sp. WH15]